MINTITKERDYHLDNVKFILILLVVIGHFIELLADNYEFSRKLFFYIYLFHMPLFVFVTGYFSKTFYDGKRIKVEKLLSYFVLFIILQLTYCLFKGNGLRLFHIPGIPWYLFSCIIWLAIIPFIKPFKKKYVIIFSFLLALLIGFDNNIGDSFALARTINFFPFFLLGHYCTEDVLKKLTTKKMKIISIVFVILVTIFIFADPVNIYRLRKLITGRNPYSKISKRLLLVCVCRILYYIGVIPLCIAVINIIPKKKNSFSIIGKRTLQIYFLHYVILNLYIKFNIPTFIMNNFTCPQLINILFSLLVFLICSIPILEYPLKKIMSCKWKWLMKEN